MLYQQYVDVFHIQMQQKYIDVAVVCRFVVVLYICMCYKQYIDVFYIYIKYQYVDMQQYYTSKYCNSSMQMYCTSRCSRSMQIQQMYIDVAEVCRFVVVIYIYICSSSSMQMYCIAHLDVLPVCGWYVRDGQGGEDQPTVHRVTHTNILPTHSVVLEHTPWQQYWQMYCKILPVVLKHIHSNVVVLKKYYKNIQSNIVVLLYCQLRCHFHQGHKSD